jgi:hypothetical protein
MPRPAHKFVICVRNRGYGASLERRKIYRVIPDARAAREQLVRVIDESGDDYLYPADYFMPVALPAPVQRALARAG